MSAAAGSVAAVEAREIIEAESSSSKRVYRLHFWPKTCCQFSGIALKSQWRSHAADHVESKR